ncbi:MAG: hypothetical protein ACQESR_30315 [Planctomycetota bacterium]
MESCPTQAVLPLVGLAADKVIRDRYDTLGDWPEVHQSFQAVLVRVLGNGAASRQIHRFSWFARVKRVVRSDMA